MLRTKRLVLQRKRRSDAAELRAWLDEIGAEVRQLPDSAFRSSGTNVRARMIKVQRRAA